jgi:hypothetical protein
VRDYHVSVLEFDPESGVWQGLGDETFHRYGVFFGHERSGEKPRIVV